MIMSSNQTLESENYSIQLLHCLLCSISLLRALILWKACDFSSLHKDLSALKLYTIIYNAKTNGTATL